MPLGSFRLNSLAKYIVQVIGELLPGNFYTAGTNTAGQFGLGFTSGTNYEPVNVSATRTLPATFVEVFNGGTHVIGLTSSGQIWGWAQNDFGQLGQGATGSPQYTPIRIGSASNWTSKISASATHTVAINSNGELWAWGSNTGGQIGQGNTTSPLSSPTRIGSANNWVECSAGSGITFAINSSGQLWACGVNTSGQLGRGNTTSPQTSLVQIGTDTNWSKIYASPQSTHVHAIRTNGTLWGWGINNGGQLGIGNTTSPQTSPVQVGTDTNWQSVSPGNGFVVAKRTTGALWIWGNNTNGELGRGNTTSPQTSPIQVGSDTNWANYSAGSFWTIAIKNNGEMWSWGTNSSGVSGQNTLTGNTLTPTRIGTGTNWSKVSGGSASTVALTTTNELWSWGQNSNGRSAILIDYPNLFFVEHNIGKIAKISQGNSSYFLALTTTGQLWGWGSNTVGQLGQGNATVPTYSRPVRIGTASNWTDISAGSGATFAINSLGELWTCGTNSSGITGLGTTTGNTVTLTRIGTDSNWLKVSGGGSHAHAIKTNGELWGWGVNTNGQLGRGNTTSPQTTPVRIGTASNWTDVESSNSHTLVRNSNGEIFVAGNNNDGRTGLSLTSGNTLSLTRIGTATNWVKISSRHASHNLAINSSGELWAWGLNSNGELGRGNTTSPQSTPVRIGTATNWSEIATNIQNSAAINTSGQLFSWGANTNGRLGLGDTTFRSSPTQVGTDTNWSKVEIGSALLALKT